MSGVTDTPSPRGDQEPRGSKGRRASLGEHLSGSNARSAGADSDWEPDRQISQTGEPTLIIIITIRCTLIMVISSPWQSQNERMQHVCEGPEPFLSSFSLSPPPSLACGFRQALLIGLYNPRKPRKTKRHGQPAGTLRFLLFAFLQTDTRAPLSPFTRFH